MLIDALILTGGRSSRLDSHPKSDLVYRHRTLLEWTLAAVRVARQVVVVGDTRSVSMAVLFAREDPPFAGPAAAIAAGLDALGAADPVASDFTLVLACDMPAVATAVEKLLHELSNAADPADAPARDGRIGSDSDGRRQPLAAVYRTEPLRAAVEFQRRSGGLDGLSVFQLIRRLDLGEVSLPAGATADVDTWADADSFGIEHP